MVDTHRRRRLAATTSAAFLLPSFPFLIASPAVAAAAAPTPDTVASLRTGIAPTNDGAAPLATAFSCGTHWAAARKCSVLCPAGDDDACPLGQHCYGGTSCSAGGEEALERQRRLERREAERLARRREEDYAPRFVCGGIFGAVPRRHSVLRRRSLPAVDARRGTSVVASREFFLGVIAELIFAHRADTTEFHRPLRNGGRQVVKRGGRGGKNIGRELVYWKVFVYRA